MFPGPRPEIDPRVARWLEEWTGAGMPITLMELTPELRNMVPDPRDLLAYGYYRPGRYGGFAPVIVACCASEAAAEACFTFQLRHKQTARWLDVHIYRLGAAVAVTTFMPPRMQT